MVPFKDRLHDLLEEHGLSQSKLAERAGLERSTISRILKGERHAGADTLKCLAPVFKMDVVALVRDTDAQSRIEEGGGQVRRQDYDAAAQKLAEYEGQIEQLRHDLHRARRALDEAQQHQVSASKEMGLVQYQLQSASSDLATERERNVALSQELRRYRLALQQAVADVSSLRGQLQDLAKEMQGVASSNRTASILAGVAALAGVVSVATYLAIEEKKDRQERLR